MIEKYKDRLKEILSDEKVVKRRSTKRRSTKRRSTKRRPKKVRSTKRRSAKKRRSKRGMLFGGELQIDSVNELNNVPEGELERVANKMAGFKENKDIKKIKEEITDLIKKRDKGSSEKMTPYEFKILGVLFKLKKYYENEKNRNDFVINSNLSVLNSNLKLSYKTDEYIKQASNYLKNSKETPPELTPDEKQKIMQMWRVLSKPEQKFINEHEKDLTNEEMRELINKVHSYYQTNPEYKPVDSFFKELNEFSTGSSASSAPLIAQEVLKQINKRKQEELENSGTKDPDPGFLFKKPEKRKSLRESLSQMVRRMSISNKRDAVRLPPNALEDISAGDPKTPEAALEKAEARLPKLKEVAARESVRRPGDDDDNYV